jgi:hypothetical protein
MKLFEITDKRWYVPPFSGKEVKLYLLALIFGVYLILSRFLPAIQNGIFELIAALWIIGVLIYHILKFKHLSAGGG